MASPAQPPPGCREDPDLAADLAREAGRRGRRLVVAFSAYGALVAAGVLLAGLGAARWPLLAAVSLAFLLPLGVVLSRPRPRRCACGATMGEARHDGADWVVCAACGRCAVAGSQPD